MRFLASRLHSARTLLGRHPFGTRKHLAAGMAAALAVTAAALLCPARAEAYCRSTTCLTDCQPDLDECKTQGFPLYWASMCVGFSLQKDGSVDLAMDDVRRVAVASFATWADVECPTGTASLTFSELADVTCAKAEYNPDGQNANIVLFQDYKWNYTGEFNTLAKTTVTYDASSGEILDADIELNQAFNELTTSDTVVVYDLQSILTHEIGHFIGLDHSMDFDATMTPGYEQGATDLRTIAPDDIAGVCAIYPPARPAVCAPTPRGGLGDLCYAQATAGDRGCSCGLASPARKGSYGLLVLGCSIGLAARRLRVRRLKA